MAATFAGAAMLCDGNPNVREADNDEGIAMFIIDPQADFHPPNGSLGVPGAVQDTERIVQLINRLDDKVREPLTAKS